jgi:predicted PurR-regulated permease PerM
MAVIGVLTTLGLWIIGIDLAMILGLIAGVLSFIPNIGPIIALIPAILIALISGPDKVIYVMLLYGGVQGIETYMLTPVLQQRMVDLPPALTISMQVLLGVLAGAVGVIVATPITAALMVMGKMWYVEDLLGDR